MRKTIVWIMVLLCSAMFLSACGQNYSNGTRAGVITKFSKKGLIFDSWEGEMLMALPATTGITTPEKFKFSTQDERMADQIQAALASGKRVELRYRQWAVAPPTIDTEYVIVGVGYPKTD